MSSEHPHTHTRQTMDTYRLGMQRYTVKSRTVRSALHGTIYPRVPRDFGFAIEFVLILFPYFPHYKVHLKAFNLLKKRQCAL